MGHGGMLDRVDALLFASVVSYYVLIALVDFPR
jgi:CDP-diglyceride synthetase